MTSINTEKFKKWLTREADLEERQKRKAWVDKSYSKAMECAISGMQISVIIEMIEEAERYPEQYPFMNYAQEEKKRKICDEYCKHPYLVQEEGRLEKICSTCPLNEI